MVKKKKNTIFNKENRLGFNILKTTKPLQGGRLFTIENCLKNSKVPNLRSLSQVRKTSTGLLLTI